MNIKNIGIMLANTIYLSSPNPTHAEYIEQRCNDAVFAEQQQRRQSISIVINTLDNQSSIPEWHKCQLIQKYIKGTDFPALLKSICTTKTQAEVNKRPNHIPEAIKKRCNIE